MQHAFRPFKTAIVATLTGLAAVGLSLIQGLSILVIPSQWQGLILYVFLFVTILFFPQGVNLQKFRQLIRIGKKA